MGCFAAELWAVVPLALRPGIFFEISIEKNSVSLEESFGYDTFLCSGVLVPGRRVAGTGRSCVNYPGSQFASPGYVSVSVPEGRPKSLLFSYGDRLSVRVRTNIFSDLDSFLSSFALRFVAGNRYYVIDPKRIAGDIFRSGDGEFVVHLENALSVRELLFTSTKL